MSVLFCFVFYLVQPTEMVKLRSAAYEKLPTELQSFLKGKTGREELLIWQNLFYFTKRNWKQRWKSNSTDGEILINPKGNKNVLIASSYSDVWNHSIVAYKNITGS